MNDKAAIDFWFDFSSPYGYLMAEKIDAVAAKHGRKVKWHPILLGVIFQATGSRPPADGVSSKGSYMLRDFARSARYMGIPYNPPSRFPLPTQNAARAYYWLHGQDCALARQFALAVYAALAARHGSINVAAAQEGLDIFAEHTAHARAHPGSHPNIDRLLAIITSGQGYAVQLLQA